MARVLIIAGHVGIGNMTAEGLCPDRDVEQLRRGTGTRGEAAWAQDVGVRLVVALRNLGIAADLIGATYDPTIYDKPYDLALALHFMRDNLESRAFAGIPAEKSPPYITGVARDLAAEWLLKFVTNWTRLTGIPVTQEKARALNITHNYVWCYQHEKTPAVLIEAGHGDLDAAALFGPKLVPALAEITRAHLEDRGLVAKPAPAPAPARTRADIAADLRRLADEVEKLS